MSTPPTVNPGKDGAAGKPHPQQQQGQSDKSEQQQGASTPEADKADSDKSGADKK